MVPIRLLGDGSFVALDRAPLMVLDPFFYSVIDQCYCFEELGGPGSPGRGGCCRNERRKRARDGFNGGGGGGRGGLRGCAGGGGYLQISTYLNSNLPYSVLYVHELEEEKINEIENRRDSANNTLIRTAYVVCSSRFVGKALRFAHVRDSPVVRQPRDICKPPRDECPGGESERREGEKLQVDEPKTYSTGGLTTTTTKTTTTTTTTGNDDDDNDDNVPASLTLKVLPSSPQT